MIRALTLNPMQASFAVLLGGSLWGLYWIPIRWLDGIGFSGPWAGIALNIAGLLLLLPFVYGARQQLAQHWRIFLMSGLIAGTAFALFTISLSSTHVAKSILLFYLTPVWSTILGRLFLGEKLTLMRFITLALGLGGMATVLGGGAALPIPQSLGEWFALTSGVLWAFATLGLFKSKGAPIAGQLFAFLFGATCILFLGSITLGYSVNFNTDQNALPILLGIAFLGIFYILPMIWLTIYPATLLSPVRVGLLLMSEVLVGLSSAALLSGDPFGWREAIGGALIVSATIFEIFR